MTEGNDVFTALTPFGTVKVDFPEDGGAVFSGPEAAVAHVRDVMGRCSNGVGATMTDSNLEPWDFLHFCQPPWSGITIVPPPDFPLEDEPAEPSAQ